VSAARGPGKPRKLTTEQEAMVAALRCAGFGVAPIAATFGVAPRTLNSILRREGVESSYGRRRLTVAQGRELIDLWRAGWTHQAMADHFSISRSTVHEHIAGTLRRDV
jgi:hypothetical protein